MSPLLIGNAATSTDVPQSQEMEAARRSGAQRQSGLGAAKDESITLKDAGGQRKVHKQSFDYVLRSGLAGGLAGCAVSNSDLSTNLVG